MKTKLLTNLTVADICEGFKFSEQEGKGLFGWSGKLTIQPEYQRNYLYAKGDGKKEQAVVESVLKGYPIGLLYFNKPHENEEKFEVLDGQQRITSLGRYLTNLFAVEDESGHPHYFDSLPQEKKNLILQTPLTIYICEGEETEIKSWFKTINIVGIPLNKQEIANSVYSGSFVTLAKEEFSNSRNSNLQFWSSYVKGDVLRQEILRVALEWVVKSSDDEKIENYMSKHRDDKNIDEMKNYFNSVIEWIDETFSETYSEMCGLDWGRIYETYHEKTFDVEKISAEVKKLYNDDAVKNPKGIFEYVLGFFGDDEKNTRLLNIRIFEDSTKRVVYNQQTDAAKKSNNSNCQLCAIGHDRNSKKIWKFNEMDADHVTAWSKGGITDIKNCQMLCKTHNRAKGNT